MSDQPPNSLLARVDDTVYVLAADDGLGIGGKRVFTPRTRRLLLALVETAAEELRNSVEPV